MIAIIKNFTYMLLGAVPYIVAVSVSGVIRKAADAYDNLKSRRSW